MKRLIVMATVCVLAMSFMASSAFAQQAPARSGYDESGVLQGLDSGSPEPEAAAQADVQQPAVQADTAGTLPFTGLDAAVIALMGIALVGSGFAVRRVVRSPQA